MTCRHIRQLHDAYVDGELSPSLTAEVHAHLLQCPECQRQVEAVRACGAVIANDRSEPALDSGFASRVVATLQKAPSGERSIAETRLARRHRWWRMAAGAAMPAAAAILFFSVLIWPTAETGVGPQDNPVPLVAGATFGGPAKALEQATDSLNQLIVISVDEARQGVAEDLDKVPQADFWRLFFEEPFGNLLEPLQPQTDQEHGDQDIVRF